MRPSSPWKKPGWSIPISPAATARTCFCKDEKGALWLIVCLEDARVDLKAAPAKIGSRRLSFGKPELLMEVLGVEPGSVTPFGLINDKMPGPT